MSASPNFPWLRWRGAVLILIAASFWPLDVMAVNLVGVGRPERVLSVAAAVWTAGLVLNALLMVLGMEVEAAENTTFITVVLAMSGGPILRNYGGPGYLILTGTAALSGWLFFRLRGTILVKSVVWGVAVALAVGPLTALFNSWQDRGSSALLAPEPLSLELTREPDIFVVLFDGYPGSLAASQDDLGTGEIDVVVELRKRGFEVPESSWAAYWTTTLSVPSLFNMGYPVETDWTELATVRDLQRVFSGESLLLEALESNGYETHMVESGWSGGSCGEVFDSCVLSPWLDEATHFTLRHTSAWGLIDGSSGPYTRGNLAAFDWLRAHGAEISESTTPDFVFAHVMAPHPPFFLRSDCSVHAARSRDGVTFNLAGVPGEERARYLVEQMDCVDRFMVEFVDLIGPEDVIVLISDHGTGRRGQERGESAGWNREAIVERLNNFLAVRQPGDCSIGDPVLVPNVFRVVLGCLSSSPVDTLPERMWVPPMEELEPHIVGELLAGADGSR